MVGVQRMRVGSVVSASVLVLSAVALSAGSATTSAAIESPVALSGAAVDAAEPSRDTIPGLLPSPTRPPVAFRSAAAAGAPVAAPGTPAAPAADILVGALGIPELVLQAYRDAEATLATTTPGCRLPWHLLAAIGRIESGHAGGGRTTVTGTTVSPILGPVLDGRSAADAVIRDTDGGALDGNSDFDRAVGPMQFIPGTWASYAADGNGDGVSDPNNVFDAALAAGNYLCSGGLDMANPADATVAVLRYNNSAAYTSNVLAWSAAYSGGAAPVVGRIGEADPVVPGPDPIEVAASAAASAELTVPPTDPAADPEAGVDDALPTTLAPAPEPAFGIPGLPPLPTFEPPPPLVLPTLPCVVACPPVEPPPAP